MQQQQQQQQSKPAGSGSGSGSKAKHLAAGMRDPMIERLGVLYDEVVAEQEKNKPDESINAFQLPGNPLLNHHPQPRKVRNLPPQRPVTRAERERQWQRFLDERPELVPFPHLLEREFQKWCRSYSLVRR